MKRNYIAPATSVVRIDAAPLLQTSPATVSVYSTSINTDQENLEEIFDFH